MSMLATEAVAVVLLVPIRLMVLGQVVLAVDYQFPVSFVEDVYSYGPVEEVAVVD